MKRLKCKSTMTWLALLLGCGSTFAQRSITPDSIHNQSWNVRAAYMGSLIYPGIKVGAELPLRSYVLTRNKRRGEKILFKSRALIPFKGFYHHSTFNISFQSLSNC